MTPTAYLLEVNLRQLSMNGVTTKNAYGPTLILPMFIEKLSEFHS